MGGYDWTANAVRATVPFFQLRANPESSRGLGVGGKLFANLGGPLYVGALADCGILAASGLLVARGPRLALGPAALAGGIGYAHLSEGGYGALVAVDIGVVPGFAPRVAWARGGEGLVCAYTIRD